MTDKLGQGLSSGTSIDVPGPGGEAYADYSQVVKSAYHAAWTPPGDFADNSASVEVSVTILRDGTVKFAKITHRSGRSALDKSVERALELKFIAPFPKGTKDDERTFIIEFNLQAKRLMG